MLFILPYKEEKDEAELTATLRSLEKYYQGEIDLLIVGHKPKTLKEESYEFIQGNPSSHGASSNLALNIQKACSWAAVRGIEEAVILNDDFILRKKISEFNVYSRKKNLKEWVEELTAKSFNSPWTLSNKQSLAFVKCLNPEAAATMPVLETHTPLPIQTVVMLFALQDINWYSDRVPQWRTLYGYYQWKFSEGQYPKATPIVDVKFRSDGTHNLKLEVVSLSSDVPESNEFLSKLLNGSLKKKSRWEL